MKRFRFTAALSLVLTLLPMGVHADDEATLPPPSIPTKESSEVTEETAPVVDLAFCIDVSGSMQGYMPVVKATILSLIRRTAQKYPGHTVRLGLVRYGDGAKRYFVLDLSEDRDRFIEHLQDTRSDAVGAEFVGDVVKKSADELTWSESAVARRLYVIGNESALQGPVPVNDAIRATRGKSIVVSAAYCSHPAGSSQGSDAQDVKQWFGSEWNIKSTWIEVARLGGGEYIQLVSDRGIVLPVPSPLVAVAWEPTTALRFADYISIQSKADQMRAQVARKSLGVPKATYLRGVGTMESGVMRYYEQHPQDATYLIRL